MSTTHPILSRHITTIDQAKAFLTYLFDNGLSYHPEDSAAECIAEKITNDECDLCDLRMIEVYELDWPGEEDPCGFVLELDPEYLANALTNQREDLARLNHETTNRESGFDEDRELGELTREIARLEKLLAERS